MPCARRPPPISISAWTSWAVRRWSRPGATRTPTWCSVAAARSALDQAGVDAAIMVDCSHANSGKDPLRQPAVLHEVIDQRLAGDDRLRAVMLESHLFDGNQPLSGELRYGVSITDGCLGWAGTEQLLLEAAQRLRG